MNMSGSEMERLVTQKQTKEEGPKEGGRPLWGGVDSISWSLDLAARRSRVMWQDFPAVARTKAWPEKTLRRNERSGKSDIWLLFIPAREGLVTGRVHGFKQFCGVLDLFFFLRQKRIRAHFSLWWEQSSREDGWAVVFPYDNKDPCLSWRLRRHQRGPISCRSP